MTDDAGRVALVSGGSRGIGRAAVLRLAADGYDVGFCYRSNEDAARELEKTAGELGVRVRAVRADVSDAGSVRGLLAEINGELGPPDTVVTAAGITKDNPLLMMRDEEWNDVIDVNLTGVYNVCRAAVFEMMKRRRGTIVNISSVAGVYGNPTQTNYSASKAGIIGFSRALAKEVGRYGIRVNVVAPGFIDTDMTSVLSAKVKDNAIASIPLGRLGTADEVADLVGYLASDRAAYITGAVFQIDGGITI
ncbi:3-oxoacyl-[acyl-carrier-protein] reductase [Actinokineospora xionganensis]|uniref:3-oxoacyl-[acyl-carrier-protein] reductase n=1 Tax=Actinokineospora xionganensis TaxID=2684470 RepID=A0ABR7L450_9PSEU|nr:3-oxoacyl-[acyl-carrier-protein] reductase [Actinokineospora xionganensis]MBC6447464.1 3-oxoacyl-[acyl-carrier-protein] reductase [Actinokineospora xionganensis]